MLEKFWTLLWKNWTIQKRHWKSGLFELVFPVLLVILFTWIKKEYAKDYQESDLLSSTVQVNTSEGCLINGRAFGKIVFSPASPWVEEFMDSVYGERENLELEVFENSAALDRFLKTVNEGTQSKSLFGIEFDDSMSVSF